MPEWQYQRKERQEESLGTGDRCQIAMSKETQTVKLLCTCLASHSAKLSYCNKMHHTVENLRLLVRISTGILRLSGSTKRSYLSG